MDQVSKERVTIVESNRELVRQVPTLKISELPIARMLNLTKLLEKIFHVTPPTHPDHPLLSSAIEQYNSVWKNVAIVNTIVCAYLCFLRS